MSEPCRLLFETPHVNHPICLMPLGPFIRRGCTCSSVINTPEIASSLLYTLSTSLSYKLAIIGGGLLHVSEIDGDEIFLGLREIFLLLNYYVDSWNLELPEDCQHQIDYSLIKKTSRASKCFPQRRYIPLQIHFPRQGKRQTFEKFNEPCCNVRTPY